MHGLARNKQTFYYALYLGKTDVRDTNGMLTGEKQVSYATPVKARANISASRGTVDLDQFGLNATYSKTITMAGKSPITIGTILWIGMENWVDSEGNSVPHNYVVTAVAESLNFTTIAIKEVNVS